MTALKNLTLSNLSTESLTDCFEELPWLREVRLLQCYKLMRLPTNLTLCSLETLIIIGCNPKLKKRCERGTGEDWPIIAHIPRLFIE